MNATTKSTPAIKSTDVVTVVCNSCGHRQDVSLRSLLQPATVTCDLCGKEESAGQAYTGPLLRRYFEPDAPMSAVLGQQTLCLACYGSYRAWLASGMPGSPGQSQEGTA